MNLGGPKNNNNKKLRKFPWTDKDGPLAGRG